MNDKKRNGLKHVMMEAKGNSTKVGELSIVTIDKAMVLQVNILEGKMGPWG